MELAGRPLLQWSLEALFRARHVGQVVIAAPPGAANPPDGEVKVVEGGPTRSQSVANALAVVEAEYVVVHDAARPLVTAELVDAVIDDLLGDPEAAGAIAAAPVTDTIKQAGGADRGARGAITVERTLDRSTLWAAQTPQAFRTAALREALVAGDLEEATDDAMLVERAGGRVLLHEAPAENIKVTTEADLRVAEVLLLARR